MGAHPQGCGLSRSHHSSLEYAGTRDTGPLPSASLNSKVQRHKSCAGMMSGPHGSAHRTNQRHHFYSVSPDYWSSRDWCQCNPLATASEHLPRGRVFTAERRPSKELVTMRFLNIRRDGCWPYDGCSRRQCSTAIATGSRGRVGDRKGARLSPQLSLRPSPPVGWRSRSLRRLLLSRFQPRRLSELRP